MNLYTKNLRLRRNHDNRKADAGLVGHVAENGILTPIDVVVNRRNRFVVLHGSRRLDAAILCGLTQVPCNVMFA